MATIDSAIKVWEDISNVTGKRGVREDLRGWHALIMVPRRGGYVKPEPTPRMDTLQDALAEAEHWLCVGLTPLPYLVQCRASMGLDCGVGIAATEDDRPMCDGRCVEWVEIYRDIKSNFKHWDGYADLCKYLDMVKFNDF